MMIPQTISAMADQVIAGRPIDRQQAAWIAGLELDHSLLANLFHAATRIREFHFGKTVRCCSIVSAKTGQCGQNCAFCSQSAHFKTHVAELTVIEPDRVFDAAMRAAGDGAIAFGIVNSGLGPSDAEVEEWGPVLQRIRKEGRITVCGSFGVLSADQAQKLAKFGMQRYNHNLQTSRRFFPNIISTHSYDDRLATLRHVKNAGISVCCGALFGMGETWADRIDLAFELRELDVDVVPINFLIPIDGTPLAGSELLDPLECLKIIALYRFCLPQKEIKIAGGRETCLRDLQSWIFFAGASSFMIGNYLTTCGRPAADDRQMVRDGGLELAESVTSSQAISAGRRV